jgi:hypothetical protein
MAEVEDTTATVANVESNIINTHSNTQNEDNGTEVLLFDELKTFIDCFNHEVNAFDEADIIHENVVSVTLKEREIVRIVFPIVFGKSIEMAC